MYYVLFQLAGFMMYYVLFQLAGFMMYYVLFQLAGFMMYYVLFQLAGFMMYYVLFQLAGFMMYYVLFQLAGFMSGVSGIPQETVKDKLFKYFCAWDCSPTFQKLQKFVSLFIMDAFVDLFITLCIVVNTTFMAIDHWEMAKELQDISDKANKVNTDLSVRQNYDRRKEGNVLFNDALNTFYLRLYGVRPFR